MKILLTGATGFIGRNVSGRKEHSYRCVVRQGVQHNFLECFIVDGMHSKTEWNEGLEGIDTIIHLAGLAHNLQQDDNDFFEINTQGTLHLASEAVKAGVSRFVFISSIGVNGASTDGEAIDEGSQIAPHNAYCKSKSLAEDGLRKISNETGLELVIIRPALVYGSGAPGNFGSLMNIIYKLPFLPFGLVQNRRSFISVDNLSDFIHTCAVHPKAAGETFVISDNCDVSTKEFINAIAHGLRTRLYQLPIPVSLMKFSAKLLGKEKLVGQLFDDLEINPSKALTLLDWQPVETMAEAMKKIYK